MPWLASETSLMLKRKVMTLTQDPSRKVSDYLGSRSSRNSYWEAYLQYEVIQDQRIQFSYSHYTSRSYL